MTNVPTDTEQSAFTSSMNTFQAFIAMTLGTNASQALSRLMPTKYRCLVNKKMLALKDSTAVTGS